jgi:hypothetical protein
LFFREQTDAAELCLKYEVLIKGPSIPILFSLSSILESFPAPKFAVVLKSIQPSSSSILAMRILKLVLLFAATITPALTSNVKTRDVNVTRYTVYPIDSHNATQTTEIEATLKRLYTNAQVSPQHEDNALVAWRVTTTDNTLQDVLTTLQGVHHVTREEKDEDKDPLADLSKRSDTKRQDFALYVVGVDESIDALKMELFLKTKVYGNKEFERLLDPDNGDLIGWTGVALDLEAKDAVLYHKGVDYFATDHVRSC